MTTPATARFLYPPSVGIAPSQEQLHLSAEEDERLWTHLAGQMRLLQQTHEELDALANDTHRWAQAAQNALDQVMLQLDLRAAIRHVMDVTREVEQAIGSCQRAQAELRVNTNDMLFDALDCYLAWRPAGHTLLAPGADIPIDTVNPTFTDDVNNVVDNTPFEQRLQVSLF